MRNNERLIHTRYGAFFIDDVRDKKMAEALANGEYPNEELLAVTRVFVNEKSVVVDVGAHVGTFAIPIAKEVEKVIAFEPFPENCTLLSRNVAENNVAIEIINKALGSRNGSGALAVRDASNAGASTLVAGVGIPITTLDSEVAHADFIKIDVEGMELEVLRGGSKLIENARPVVLFEVNLSQLRLHGASPRALERFFTRREYRLCVPIGSRNGVLARVGSATLLTALIAPRAWLFFSESAPFDLVAIPKERIHSLDSASFGTAIAQAIKNNLMVKILRLKSYFVSVTSI